MDSNKFVKYVVRLFTVGKVETGDIFDVKELNSALSHSVVIFSLILGIIFSTFFGTLTYLHDGEYVPIIFKYLMSALLLVAFINVCRGKNYFINGKVVPLLVFGTIFLYLWYSGSEDGLKGIWIVLLPLINTFIGGVTFGMSLSLLEYLFVLIVGVVDGFGGDYTVSQVVRFSCVYFTVLVLSFFLELIRTEFEKNVKYLDKVVAGKNEIIYNNDGFDTWLGIYNWNGFVAMSDIIWKQAIRDKVPISILVIDIDSFKGIKDKFGFWACEDILKQIAVIVMQNVRRPLDLAVMYRHDVYCVLLYSADIKPAANIAEKIRSEVEECKFEHRGFMDKISATVSVGIATEKTPSIGNSCEKLIEKADDNLQTAKKNGRNRCFSGEN